ncbi:MAG: triose-phosphate isomerase [Desulfurispora sp.]|uniref:triose-phosphate isomerase n=1 Tax=Desulfurispora sp. TaxID=3014275 RepID=UPI0040490B4F
MRRPLIAGNWKMHNTAARTRELLGALQHELSGYSGPAEVAVCPPFTSLAAAAESVQNTSLVLGAQNMHYEEKGAYTGEISPLMLAELGCRYVILGHSERRQYFAEDDALINRKVRAALQYGLVPILCVGELLEQRQARVTEAVIRIQLAGGLAGLTPQQVAGLVIAYEPVWAIGTGKTASPADAQQVNAYIRQVVGEFFGGAAAQAVRILYGGSVNAGNAAELLGQADVDGALVGGASLDAAGFAAIVRAAR